MKFKKYGEPTKRLCCNIPESMYAEVESIVGSLLRCYALDADILRKEKELMAVIERQHNQRKNPVGNYGHWVKPEKNE